MTIILTALGLVACTAFLMALVLAIRRGFSSRNWHTATAKIVASRVNRIDRGGDEVYEPLIAYRYNVNGTDYIGHDIAVITLQYGTDRGARKRIVRYPVGTDVFIYYDPRDPAASLLEPGPRLATTAFALVLVLILISWLVADLVP